MSIVANALPSAQSYVASDAESFRLPDSGLIFYPENRPDLKSAAAWLAEQLGDNENAWLLATGEEHRNQEGTIQFLPLAEHPDIPYKHSDKRFLEAYRIEFGKIVRIFAGGRAGARYAVQRLLELWGEDQKVPLATVVDYPDYIWRGVVIRPAHTPCGDPMAVKSGGAQDWLECMDIELDKLASLRLNLLGLMSPVFYRLNEPDMRLLQQLFARARDRNLEPMPVLNSKLTGIPGSVLKTDAIEGVYHQQVPFLAKSGKLVSGVPDENLIINGDFEGAGVNHWRMKHRPLTPSWHLAMETLGGGARNHYLSIEFTKDGNPLETTTIPQDPKNGKLIPVKPGQYYELGVNVRSSSNVMGDGQVLLWVAYYDQQQRHMKELARGAYKNWPTDEWTKSWISIFTSEETHFLWFRFAPQSLTEEAIRLDIDDVELRVMGHELINVLSNLETTPIVTSENGEHLYESERDYQLKLAPVRSWRDVIFSNIERTRIEVPLSSRIADGAIVKVRFDSLPLEYRTHQQSKYSAASQYTYAEYRRIFAQLSQLAPVYIHIAMDEHMGGLNRGSRSRKLNMTNRDLLITYLNTLDAVLRREGEVDLPGGTDIIGVGAVDSRLVIWDDMINPWHNGGNSDYQVTSGGLPGDTRLVANDPSAPKLNHSILLASWWYRGDDSRDKVKNSPDYFRNAGYRFFAAAWYQKAGILRWLETLMPDETEGLIATTWGQHTDGVEIIACAAWNRSAYETCASL